MLTGIGCAAKVPLQLLKRYEALPERYKKPYKSRVMQKETGHQSRYALYQNWCPVMVRVVIRHFLKTIVVQFVFEAIG